MVSTSTFPGALGSGQSGVPVPHVAQVVSDVEGVVKMVENLDVPHVKDERFSTDLFGQQVTKGILEGVTDLSSARYPE